MTKPIVLVVEDDPTLRGLTRLQLRKLGCDCVLVESGEAALAYNKEHIALVFMDIGLPGMDGIYTTMLIREEELRGQKKRVPIVAVTGHADRESVMKKSVGMDDFLQKPALLNDLKQIIDKYIPIRD